MTRNLLKNMIHKIILKSFCIVHRISMTIMILKCSRRDFLDTLIFLKKRDDEMQALPRDRDFDSWAIICDKAYVGGLISHQVFDVLLLSKEKT